ncbi:hypothetical protein KT71_12170 [Congregibacter litoralis KT71]|uniref:Uncharacterized protein n=2 Tax=Congregibacter TaxID=393661 RepID=A4AAD8_9GAMM|nr:hypothetical protein KT71_12170 [Congregibacter litoralis KT71]
MPKSFIWKNTMTKSIGAQRWHLAEKSLRARITYLQGAIDSGQLPAAFELHKSNKTLMDWHDADLGIYKIGVNTARDSHPDAWSTLQDLRLQIKAIVTNEANSTTDSQLKGKSKKSESKTARANSACPNCQTLTDELVALRLAYLELRDHLSAKQKKGQQLQNAIRRHAKDHGLKAIIGTGKVSK